MEKNRQMSKYYCNRNANHSYLQPIAGHDNSTWKPGIRTQNSLTSPICTRNRVHLKCDITDKNIPDDDEFPPTVMNDSYMQSLNDESSTGT